VTGARARVMGIVLAAALAFGVAYLFYLTPKWKAGGIKVTAEFRDVRPLNEGSFVKVNGARAGKVARLELTDRGTVMATLRINDGLGPPRRDAVAMVRSEDFVGETYVSLSPGDDPEPLRDPIPLSRTGRPALLQDMLNDMRPQVQVGLKFLLSELGRAFERRGQDLNRAIVELRPAFDATDQVFSALSSQNADIRGLITSAQHATRQVARRSRDLDQQLVGLDRLLTATAARSPQLERGLETLPPTLEQVRGTLARTRRLAISGQPLAREMHAMAPGLAETARRLGPFVDQTRVALDHLRPTLRLTRRALRASEPTLPALISALRQLRTSAPDIAAGMEYSVPQAVRSLTEGFIKERGSSTAEPGNQPARTLDPRRFMFRSTAMFGCETLGYKKERDCLASFLKSRGVTPPSLQLRKQAKADRSAPARGRSDSDTPRTKERQRATRPERSPSDEDRGPAGPAQPAAPQEVPPPVAALGDLAQAILGQPPDGGPQLEGQQPDSSATLLDFLLGP
jgi:virulence factor Mce-like protein